MNREDIKTELVPLVYELFKDQGFEIDNIETADFVDDIGMDSIMFISMVIKIESQFGINVPSDLLLIENFMNIDGIITNIISVIGTSKSRV